MFSIIETNKVIGLVFWLWLSLTRLLRDYINYDTNQFPSYFCNDPSHFADQWKQKCSRNDMERFLFPFGAMQ